MINLGDKQISDIKLGATNIVSVYQGSKLVWPDKGVKGYVVDASVSLPADYCLYDSQEDKIIIVHPDDSGNTFGVNRYEPIGVVAVPGTHNVYGDGSCGVISLKYMSISRPDGGSDSYATMYCGQHSNYLSGLSYFTTVPIGNTEDGLPTEERQTQYGCLPIDNLEPANVGEQCLHDANSYYEIGAVDRKKSPSPYLTDGSRNPGYYQTSSPSSTSNSLSDFDGKGNSQILWDAATAQSDWKTATAITNSTRTGYSPAACCCWRYHTSGTQQGDWYLPAMGELGYACVRRKIINESITELMSVYDDLSIAEVRQLEYISSSVCSDTAVNAIYFERGNMTQVGRGEAAYVRAFLRVPSQL